MKKSVYVLLLIILLSSLVYAGAVKQIELSNEGDYVILNERDAISFNYLDTENLIMVRTVQDENKVDITIFTDTEADQSNSDNAVPSYLTLAKNMNAQLDIDRNKEADVALELTNVNGKEVTLFLKLLEPGDEIASEDSLTQEDTQLINMPNILSNSVTGLLILIALVLIYLVFKKRK